MSFSRPTIRALIARARSDMKRTVDKVNAYLRETFEDALAITTAGLTHSLHGHIFWASKQAFLSTADEPGVREWSFILNVPQRDASFAQGPVIFSGTAAAPIPIGSQFQRSDGIVFATTDALVIGGGGTVTGNAKAVLSGAAGNTAGNTPLTAVSAIPNVSSDAIVDGSGITGGADVEDVESLRTRGLYRMQNIPAGGNEADFIRWAFEVPGVTRAWCYRNGMGAGTVLVYFCTDDPIAGPIPNPSKVTEVYNYIESKRPALGTLFVSAPTALPIPITLSIIPDNAALRAQVLAAIDDYFTRFGNTSTTIPTTVPKSQIDEVISQVADEQQHVLSAPAGNTALTQGQIPVRGTTTWV